MGKKRIDTDGAPALTDNPFAKLGGAFADLPEGQSPVEASPEPPPKPSTGPFGPKVVVRREKKGRGGKTASIIEGLRGDQADLEELARALGKQLGCGTHVEGATIVSQGSQTDRIRAWLIERGAPNVIIGN